jgi:preprotein translocase subunit SecA
MIAPFIAKLFGSRNQRLLKRLQKNVDAINALEGGLKPLSDDQLKAKTTELKQDFAKGATLDDILVEAFAVVREAAIRTMGMRHFDVQLIGGMVLHLGKIAEMRTGEGKTLMSTLPIYLNALAGRGVHVVTVNDYLAKRDAAWMQPIYEFLGLSVGVILSGQSSEEKREAYNADITYGTNNEYGFDYLRDNMAFGLADKVQRELNFAVIDEVDSILIDEARTPLIISGAAEDSSDLYKALDKVVPQLTRQATESKEGEAETGDYFVDEKTKQVTLTEAGHTHVEAILEKAGLLKSQNLYDVANINLLHHLNAALRAHICFQKDVDYIVQNNEVIIVDEHTGRTMIGRRWSDGLHQAMEAKEGVQIQNENMTLASITFQNFFRLYDKLGGMTGTADTEAYEFQQIYGLEVTVIPTNRPMVRQDLADQIYLTVAEKYRAVIEDIKVKAALKQPVLVGTASIEASEHLSALLKQEKIAHQVLNAKFHEKEAQIIAEAGRPGAVTIATNMAGRGTDIKLGGNLDLEIAALENPTEAQITALKADWATREATVRQAGGLHIIGSERHESRRIDNQLRGRAGRQGDPGSSRFYLSLQDNLMRIFASERLAPLMQRLGLTEGEAIEHAWLNKIIENAQRKVEGHNFDIRKQLLEFDDVANEQRKVFYSQRNQLMERDDISETIKDLQETVITDLVNRFVPPGSLIEQWDIVGLDQKLATDFGLDLHLQAWLEADLNRHELELKEMILQAVLAGYQGKEAKIGQEVIRQLEKSIMLQSVDQHWRDHLSSMDQLRQGIHLRGYAQKNPKQEYKRESFTMFTTLLDNIKQDVISALSRLQLAEPEDVNQLELERRRASTFKLQYQHDAVDGVSADAGLNQSSASAQPFIREQVKLGRNDPCYCGSEKKYKQCHGKVL